MDWRNDPRIQAYLYDVKKDCDINNIQLILTDKAEDTTFGEIICSGYFDSEAKKLVASTEDDEDPNRWVTLLAHEHCHLRQFVEKDPAWENTKIKGFEANSILDMWLNYVIELNEEQLKDCVNRVIELELNCEKRTVEMIKKYDLPFDTAEYTQRSNAYVLMYQMVRKYRKWSIYGKAPAGKKDLYSQLSSSFDMNYLDFLSPELESLFMQSFFE